MDNLIAIENCKNDIKSALINKGVDMTDVIFSEYAEKIDALQLESGDTPAPTPSADYIYSNGYLTSGTETNEIINIIPHEIVLDSEGKCAFELTCPIEIKGKTGKYRDIIFTVEIPENYKIIGFDIKGLTGNYEPYTLGYKENPRYSSKERNGIIYNSFVRNVADEKDYASMDVATDILYYKITIESI
jgi:hypothetical protein